jgi:hypothetical protein
MLWIEIICAVSGVPPALLTTSRSADARHELTSRSNCCVRDDARSTRGPALHNSYRASQAGASEGAGRTWRRSIIGRQLATTEVTSPARRGAAQHILVPNNTSLRILLTHLVLLRYLLSDQQLTKYSVDAVQEGHISFFLPLLPMTKT